MTSFLIGSSVVRERRLTLPMSLLFLCQAAVLACAAEESRPSSPQASAMASAATPTYAPLPEPVTSFGAVVDGGHLYVYGGHLGEQHEYAADTVSTKFRRLRLVPGSSWEELPSGPAAQGASLVAYHGAIIRVGGMAARNTNGSA